MLQALIVPFPSQRNEGLVWFVLFNDTWSQKGHSVSCMTILFISKCNQQIGHQAAHKVGCQPGDFAYGHFNLPPGFVWVYMG